MALKSKRGGIMLLALTCEKLQSIRMSNDQRAGRFFHQLPRWQTEFGGEQFDQVVFAGSQFFFHERASPPCLPESQRPAHPMPGLIALRLKDINRMPQLAQSG